MKKIMIIMCCLPLLNGTYLVRAQDTNRVISDDEEVQIIEEGDELIMEMDEVVKEEPADTTKLKIGDKKVEVLKKKDETQLSIKELDEEEEEEEEFDWKFNDDNDEKKSKKFKGHWTGLDIGINNLVDKNFSLSRATGEEYMDINTGRSWNFNLNFFKSSFGIINDRVGFVTGLGMEWNNYHFDGDNNIQEVNGIIESKIDYPATPNKTKLATTYITAPLLLEAQILPGKRKKRIYVSAGVIGGLKIGSHTKVVYRLDGQKKKEKDKDDFNLSPLRYGLTARAGYKALDIYANYYLTPLFIKDKGPELYPFSIGLAFGL